MDLRKIALGLLFGGALAAGSIACDDSTSSSNPASRNSGAVPTACTTFDSDTDSGATSVLTVTHVSLPATDGFNLDGINNSAQGGSGGGMGKTIAGCGMVDLPNSGGKDNALAGIAAVLGGTDIIDLNADLQAALMNANMGGTLTITARLTHLSSPTVADDPCIGAEITFQNGATTNTFVGSGSLQGHVASIAFQDQLNLDISVNVPAMSCVNQTCNPGDLNLVVYKPVAHVVLNSNNSEMQEGTLIGGYVFYYDPDPAYAGVNPTGFMAALDEYAAEVNLDPSVLPAAVDAFEGARDLHMDPTETLSPCTSATGTISGVNPNAVSMGLYIDSM